MKKRFLVIGAGRFGHAIMEELHRKAEVVAIDVNEKSLEDCSDYTDYSVIGDANDRDVLEKIDVTSFDAIVVAIGAQFSSSILITKKLHDLGAKKIIAKATTKEIGEILLAIGASEVVFPEKEAGIQTANSLLNQNILEYFELNDHISAIETVVPAKFIAKKIADLNLPKTYGLTIAVHLRNHKPTLGHLANMVIEENDIILLVGENEKIKTFREKTLG